MNPTPTQEPPDAFASKDDSQGEAHLKLQKYFEAMIKTGASDLHLKPNRVPQIRIRSVLHPVQAQPMTERELTEMAYEFMDERQRGLFEERGNVDIAEELPGSDRFRINIYRQRSQVAMAIRRVTREIPDFESLHLPEVLAKIASEQHGLVLLSGSSGSGKSTTIAAMLEYVNKTRPCHILTIEDPIEYVFEDKTAYITQREVGIDVDDFETALKHLMREDPDLVLIGEMRDHETFAAALRAAETGHLVFATVHASTVSQTVSRILDLIGPESRDVARGAMANNLKAIICQKLLPSIAEGIDRVPAVEIMLINPSVRQLIEEGREGELIEVIRSHENDGMQAFTTSLMELIANDLVDPHVAYDAAPNPDELKMMVKGISASRSGLLGRG